MRSSFRVSAAGVIGTLAALLVVGICVRLGIWQLDRRSERLTRNQVISARMAEPAYSITELLGDSVGLVYRVGEVEGEWDPAHSLLLAGRSHQGTPGAHLLAPLLLEDGGAILVNRGWLPSLDASRVDPGDYLSSGQVELRGLLLPFPDLVRSGTARRGPGEITDFRRVRYRLDGEGLSNELPYGLSVLYLQELGDLPGSEYPIPLSPPELDAGPHLGYAIQWFIFATIGLVGWMILLSRGSGRQAAIRSEESL